MENSTLYKRQNKRKSLVEIFEDSVSKYKNPARHSTPYFCDDISILTVETDRDYLESNENFLNDQISEIYSKQSSIYSHGLTDDLTDENEISSQSSQQTVIQNFYLVNQNDINQTESCISEFSNYNDVSYLMTTSQVKREEPINHQKSQNFLNQVGNNAFNSINTINLYNPFIAADIAKSMTKIPNLDSKKSNGKLKGLIKSIKKPFKSLRRMSLSF